MPTAETIADLHRLVGAQADDAVALRREIHRAPEVGHTEVRTTARVAEYLAAAGLEPEVRGSGTGLLVEVGRGDRMVGFRADLDALPVDEPRGLPFASETPGVMHACGHDVHTAIAAGLARTLAAFEDLPGRVRFVFQPAEEMVPGGAVALRAEGVTQGLEALLAFHVDPSQPPGTVALRSGPITSASDRIQIELMGPGGHTSRPHKTVDLIQAAARVVIELPAYVQRVTDPRHPVALVFGRIGGGVAENVIPTSVEVAGTARMFDLDLWRDLPQILEKAVHEIVAPLGATPKVSYERGAPPVVNDEAVVRAVAAAARTIVGDEGVVGTEQSLGAEDFAWYLEDVPGALIRLGSAPADRTVDLHSANFVVDETCIPTGMLVGAAALIELLQS